MTVFAVSITYSEARRAVEGRKEFRVKEDTEEGYAVVNYDYCHAGTFPPVHDELSTSERRVRQILRECRGLVFCLKSEKVIARRFHKFFNVGEKEETHPEAIDTSRGFVLLNKLDGQLVSPFKVASGVRWGTKMCVTPDMAVEKSFTNYRPNYCTFAEMWLAKGVTPLFEWCSPLSPIVIKFETHKLVLTAMRENDSGRYFSYEELIAAATEHDIDVVEPLAVHEEGMSVADTLARVQAIPNIEGCVMVLPDGNMYKMKTQWYFALSHRQKACGFSILKEEAVWDAILNGTIDDHIPMLPSNLVNKIQVYSAYLWASLGQYAEGFHPDFKQLVAVLSSDGRRAFAAAVDAKSLSAFERKFLLGLKAPVAYSSDQEFCDSLLKNAVLRNMKTFKVGSKCTIPGVLPWTQVMHLSDDDCEARLAASS
eukprot:TRINITY_DN162_c0_g4_i1.p1 TRINITY_DN162_c0_g4~~TRINITY_DN162_c0_g4_i1.p1  ORF type:complete len:425 (+),score=136.46 TRINITY_DN162_c0_g4_i1:37-1311(+)